MKTVTIPFPFPVRVRMKKGHKEDLRLVMTTHDVDVPVLESEGNRPGDAFVGRGRRKFREIVQGRLYHPVDPYEDLWTIDTIREDVAQLLSTASRPRYRNFDPFEHVGHLAGYKPAERSQITASEVAFSDHDAALARAHRLADDFAFIDGKGYTCRFEPVIALRRQGIEIDYADRHRTVARNQVPGIRILLPVPIQDAVLAHQIFGSDKETIDRVKFLAEPFEALAPSPKGDWLARAVEDVIAEALGNLIPHGSESCFVGRGDPGMPDLPDEIEDLCQAGRAIMRTFREARIAGSDVSGHLDEATAFAEEIGEAIGRIATLNRLTSTHQHTAEVIVEQARQARIWWTGIERDRRHNPVIEADEEDIEALALLAP